MEVYADSIERKIVLVELVEDPVVHDALLAARLKANAKVFGKRTR